MLDPDELYFTSERYNDLLDELGDETEASMIPWRQQIGNLSNLFLIVSPVVIRNSIRYHCYAANRLDRCGIWCR
jgi:hypothetical protein